MRKMYAASWNLFTLTAEADRILCDVFNCLFPLDVQNEIQVLSKVFCYSRLVCLLFFDSEMRRLSKSEIRFRMVSFSFFTLLVERDQRMTIVRKVKSNRLLCLLKLAEFSLPRSVWNQDFNCNKTYFICIIKKIKLEPAIIWKLVTCQRITSKNTRPRWVDTWARDTVMSYCSEDTLFWQLSIDNIDVQYVCNISFPVLPM